MPPKFNVKQEIINNKFIKYLEIQATLYDPKWYGLEEGVGYRKKDIGIYYKPEDLQALIETIRPGQCSGLTDDWLYKKKKGQGPSFFKDIHLITSWDETPESLEAEVEVGNKKEVLGNIFENMLNDLRMLQFSDLIGSIDRPSEIRRLKDKGLSETIKPRSVLVGDLHDILEIMQGQPILYREYSLAFPFHKDELLYVLEKIVKEGKMIHIAANQHIMGIMMVQGKYYAYDSNEEETDDQGTSEKIFEKLEDLENYIEQRLFERGGYSVENMPLYIDTLLGPEIENLSDEELSLKVEETSIFAKLSPLQKARIIKCLQANKHIVGFLGDGINDAAGLRDADVGISVDTATDIARESADIILLEKSLLVLGEGVLQGRGVYGNIIKYIKMTTSSNFGNVFSVLVASSFLPFLPMLPLQLLIQNLFYDFSQLSIPWDQMDKEFLQRPRTWDPSGIARFMVFIGPISSIFDMTTFALMWYFYQANSLAEQALFQSGWFIEGLLSQTLIVHMIRTRKIPFIQSIASTPVLLTTAASMAIGIYFPFSKIGADVQLVPLHESYFLFLAITLLSYCVITQLVKIWYIKKFNSWL